MRKRIEVVAGVLREGDRVLAMRRGYGEFEGLWEFPGGKVEAGEGDGEALRREMREELTVDVEVGERVCVTEFDYPGFHLTLRCYWCGVRGGELRLLEHKEARWVGADEIDGLEWLPADREVIEVLKGILKG